MAPTSENRRHWFKGYVKYSASHADKPILDDALTVVLLAWIIYFVARLSYDHELSLLAELLVYTVAFSLMIVFCKSEYGFSALAPRLFVKGNLEKARNVRKFGDQSWQLVIHFAMSVAELWLLYRPSINWSWWTMRDSDEVGGMWENVEQKADGQLNSVYLAQLVVWTVTAVSHRFFEARHKDYFVMYSHHIATVSLIAISWTSNALRVGLLVMLVHDSSDIITDLLKMANYAGLDAAAGWYLSESLFILNIITWALTRLYYYAFEVVGNAHLHWPKLLPTRPADGSTTYEYLAQQASLVACLTLLYFLVVLNVLWWCLFWRILYRLLKKEKAHEIGADEYEGTSESEDDEIEGPTDVCKRKKKN